MREISGLFAHIALRRTHAGNESAACMRNGRCSFSAMATPLGAYGAQSPKAA
jgi:hypothetical protein